ncbi:MAG: hypothetical protein GVY28_07845 [Alphaproteobacteria bacterium]|jgi:ELWxxDGT repeat protein|nr:hypothetical protein [Alphaproteobacteria bacterium]
MENLAPSLVFSAFSAETGRELYRVKPDGEVELLKDINPGSNESDPNLFTEFNGSLYFQAQDESNGDELYRLSVDGSVTLVQDINPGPGDGRPFGFTPIDDSLYFTARDGNSGSELYRVKSFGIVEAVAEYFPGPMSSTPTNFFTFGNALYFVARDEQSGFELRRSFDGGKGADVVRDINPGSGSSSPGDFVEFNGSVYFSAFEPEMGRELYRLMANGEAFRVTDINPGPGNAAPTDLTEFAGDLYFAASENQFFNMLYRVKQDGMIELVDDVVIDNGMDGADFTKFNGNLYFSGDKSEYGTELFRVTSTGTVSLAVDIEPGFLDSTPAGFTEFNGALYFAAKTKEFGREVYRLQPGDNGQDSAMRVTDIFEGMGSANPEDFTVYGDALYFSATDGSTGRELWRIDSNDDFTRVNDINPGSDGSDPEGFMVFPPPVPMLSVAPENAEKSEGDSGTTTFTFTVTRSQITDVETTVTYVIGGDGEDAATADDFDTGGLFPSGTLIFAPGQTSETVSVPVAGDTQIEPDEGFKITLMNPGGDAIIITATATGLIENDDEPAPPAFAIAASDADKDEGDSGTRDFTFTVTRSGDTGGTASVDYAVDYSGDDRADSADFDGPLDGTLTFEDGEDQKTVTVTVAGDTDFEPDEAFAVTLSNPSEGASITEATASGTILNDDQQDLPSFSIVVADADKNEGNSGTTPFTFTVTRDIDTPETIAVGIEVVGSGEHPADPNEIFGVPTQLSFDPTDMMKTLTIGVTGDTDVEEDESFTVTISAGDNATIAQDQGSATGIIRNDDEVTGPVLSVSAEQSELVEGAPGEPTELVFTITRDGVTDGRVEVGYAVIGVEPSPADPDDFAEAGGEFPAGTVTFEDGVTEQTVTVIIRGNDVVEDDKYFALTLSPLGEGVEFAQMEAQVMIQNDDELPDPAATIDRVTVVQDGIVGGGASIDNLYTIPANPDLIGENVQISDPGGDNFIHLFAGIEIEMAEVASGTVRLTLTTGEEITILEANQFSFLVGGNPLSGDWAMPVTYEQFVENTLGIAGGVPEEGMVTGGPVTIGDDAGGGGGNQGDVVDLNAFGEDVTGTAAAETFSLDVDAAKQSGLQCEIFDFDTAADTLRLDLAGTPAGIDTLEELDGLDLGDGHNAAVQINEIAGDTLLNLGLDQSGNLVTLCLQGIDDPAAVDVILA